MNPQDFVRAGKLSEARQLLTERIRSSPGDMGMRTLLFQVLSFYGEWDKAARHLDVIVTQDAKKETGVQVYRNLVHAEKERLEVLKLGRRPSCMPQTPPYMEMYFMAREALDRKKVEEAEELFDRIRAQLPVISGTLDGKEFEGFKDTDSLLSLFLEAFVHDRYVWIPLESIRELSISPPKTLFDLLWVSGRVTTGEGLSLNCFLPVLYPASFMHDDDRVKLGRMTDWASLGGSFEKGMGQHVFQVGEDEVAILEIREALFKARGEAGNHEESN